MTELLQIFDELEARGWVCLLKWDGERASKCKTVVISKSDKLFRGDFCDFEQALASLRIWLQKEQVVVGHPPQR
jgi:hypothetical protein